MGDGDGLRCGRTRSRSIERLVGCERLNSELEKLRAEYTEFTLTFPAGRLYIDAGGTTEAATSGNTLRLVVDDAIEGANVGRGTDGRVCFGWPRVGRDPLCRIKDEGAGRRGILVVSVGFVRKDVVGRDQVCKYLSTKDVQTCLNLSKFLSVKNLHVQFRVPGSFELQFYNEKEKGKDQAPFEGSRKVIKSVGGGGEERESGEPLEGGRRDGEWYRARMWYP